MNPMHHAPAQGPVRQDRLYVGGEGLDPMDGRLVDVIKGRDEGARLVIGCRPSRSRPRVLRAADDPRHGVAIANDSAYGLSGSAWGPDVEHAKDIARRIRSGNVAINQHTLDLGGPFGGFKQSGLGREYGLEGIEEYVEIQTIPYLREPVQQ